MKDKKKMRLAIAFAVLVLGGLVYYWFFYTPTLGDYVYVERPNMYSYVIHSKENCGEIHKGVFRDKTSEALKILRENKSNILYCSKCMSFDMINKYYEEIKRQKEEARKEREKVEKLKNNLVAHHKECAKQMFELSGDSSFYYDMKKSKEQILKEAYENALKDLEN